jgi:GNAT superfamily N-acetyltransferase
MHLLRQLLCRLTIAIRMFQKEGWRAGLTALGRTVSRVLYQRAEYIVMANDLSGQVLLADPKPGLVIRQATTREEIASLSSMTDLADLERFYRMFDRGSVAFIAFQNDQAVGYGWISQVMHRSVHRVPPPLRPGDACLHDLFVSPAHRGQGIGHALISYRLRFLHDHGYKRAITVVRKDNTPSLKANKKTGYTRIGEMSHARFLFWDRLTYNVPE